MFYKESCEKVVAYTASKTSNIRPAITIHEPILVIYFGRNVTEKAGNQ